jgi:structural maintenance of chromosome 1
MAIDIFYIRDNLTKSHISQKKNIGALLCCKHRLISSPKRRYRRSLLLFQHFQSLSLNCILEWYSKKFSISSNFILNQLIEKPPSNMPVTYIELENFKSYAGIQRIGPFKDFTSVIGPNGSGKSNLMDAISFVFGVQSRDLRSSQMKDLIFRPPGNKSNATKLRASATLIYQHDEEEIRFSRSISPNGVGDYRVDGKVVSFAQYEERLGDIGVILKARNFLVFQGDVESLANKNPNELVEMFEQFSGSIEYKQPYEEALKKKDQAEAATVFAYNKQKSYKQERRLLKEQKEEAERFDSLLDKKSKLQTEMYLWSLYHIDSDMQEREEAMEELDTEKQEHEKDANAKAKLLKEAKKQASAARRQVSAAEKKRVKLASAVDELEPSIIKNTEEIKNLSKKVKMDEKQLAKTKKEAETHDQTFAALDKEIAEYKETLVELESDYEQVKRGATGPDQVTLTEEQEAEYERVREAAAAASDKPRRKLTLANRKLSSARAKAANLAQEYEEVKNRRDEAARDVRGFTERKEKLSEVSTLLVSKCLNKAVSPNYFCLSFSLSLAIELGQDEKGSD